MIEIRIHDFKNNQEWNNFIENSNNGTIFHHIDFLNYHCEELRNTYLFIKFYKGGNLIGIIPMTVIENNNKKIAKSMQGASWGGLVYNRKTSIKYILEMVKVLIDYLKESGINEVWITPTPLSYFKEYNNYFEFSLFSNGFYLSERNNNLILELPDNVEKIMEKYDSHCRTQTRKGLKNFEEYNMNTSVEDFYPILLDEKKRHNSSPTHTLEDLKYLKSKFSDKIIFDTAIASDGSKAGICYFVCNNNCVLSFYISQETRAIGKSGLNALIYKGMQRFVDQKIKYFDFGLVGNNSKISKFGVAEFKESFGARGIFRDTYKCVL